MLKTDQSILVLPRKLLESHNYFRRWEEIEHELDRFEHAYTWKVRSLAEDSDEWVQPIPVTLLRDEHHRYCILRRTRSTRSDIRGRLTLVIGGHVEYSGCSRSFMALLRDTLHRELYEEVGLQLNGESEPIGVAFNPSSIFLSRHLAFVFETRTSQQVRPKAPEEFAKTSKYSGRFLSASELNSVYRELDPWSVMIFANYIDPSLATEKGWQATLPLPNPAGSSRGAFDG